MFVNRPEYLDQWNYDWVYVLFYKSLKKAYSVSVGNLQGMPFGSVRIYQIFSEKHKYFFINNLSFGIFLPSSVM